MDKIAVLIPCYNEEATVEKVVRDFKAALPEAVVYVYDNNSTDNTAQLAAAAGAVVRKEPNQGKGNVIRRMFREIDAECYIMADGDDTYPAEYAPEMANYVLQENADMVIGERRQLRRDGHGLVFLSLGWYALMAEKQADSAAARMALSAGSTEESAGMVACGKRR